MENIRLFLDTNIYLSFYRFNEPDITALESLTVLLKRNRIELIITDQVKNEFYRNRESEINNCLKNLDAHFTSNYPGLIRHYPEFEELKRIGLEYVKLRGSILEKIKSDQSRNNLKADILVENLFKKAICYHTTDEVYFKALKRVNCGNPPGKNKSYCDAINWEIILENLNATFEEFYFISADGDYSSEINKQKFNTFLDKEMKSKGIFLKFFNSLPIFLKEKFSITFSDQYEIDLLIEELNESPTFRSTHRLFNDLRQYKSFNKNQLVNLIESCISNDQIFRIVGDPGIGDYLIDIVNSHREYIDKELLNKFNSILNEIDTDDFFEDIDW